MKFTAAAAASVLAFVSTASAGYITSKPFRLQVLTSESKYNGTVLSTAHEGAGIESLNPVTYSAKEANFTTFYFKHYSNQEASKYGVTGDLIYDLSVEGANGTEIEKSPMNLYVDPSTNVALALLEPTESGTQVAFDSDENMNQQSYLNDKVTPPTDTTVKAYYRWYICETNYEGYTYTNLNWIYGKFAPQNPSCVAATIKRVFIS